MMPISPSAPPALGSVLFNPLKGLVVVSGYDGPRILAVPPGESEPVTCLEPSAPGYRACVPHGLIARSLQDRGQVIAELTDSPIDVLAAGLADSEGGLRFPQFEAWLVALGLCDSMGATALWARALAGLAADGRFVLHGDEVRLPSMFEELEEDSESFEALEVTDTPPMPSPGTLPASEAFEFAITASRALADVHGDGKGIIRLRSAVSLRQGVVEFQYRESTQGEDRRDDVRFVMRMVLEQVVGILPITEHFSDSELPFLVGLCSSAIPFELLAVCIEALADDASYRPSNGLALLSRLHTAQAAAQLRSSAPWLKNARLSAGFDTHIGLFKSLVSQTNQDAFLLAGEPDLALFAVADGISLCTAGSGDRASSLLIRALRQEWTANQERLRHASSDDVHAFIERALDHGNSSVCEAALKAADGDLVRHVPMGTTVLAAVSRGNRVHLSGLGDSRGYLVGPHGAAPLSVDQNLQSARLIAALEGEEVNWEEPGHALLGYVGHFDMDGRPSLPRAFTRTLTMLPGEWLILCSDGFSDYAATDEAAVIKIIQQCIRESNWATGGAAAMDLARKLTAAANRGGGGDNVTVLAFTLSGEDLNAENSS